MLTNSGILLVNKPKGLTSYDVVHQVKNILGTKKVGHSGTLDPLATGVLPILIGKGTLCSKYLINHDKTYQVELKLGIKTETADSEGKIVEKKEVPEGALKEETIKEVLNSFLGKQTQVPPIYSAIKVRGKKLYEYARSGKKVEIEPRNIEIYKIELKNIDKINNVISFEVSCSKGTYIRSLCEDIAKKLGTVGYMLNLNRTQVGQFNISDSIKFEDLQNLEETDIKEFINRNIITVEQLFKDKENIELDTKKLELFLNGVRLTQNKHDEIYKIYSNNNFIGIGTIKDNLLKRDIII